ncbi:MAG: tetratricopeptide repeat protein, partial [Pseudomonadota bacterium]
LQVYQVQKEILPKDNRDRLISEGTLASIYLNKGDLDKALEFALQVCQVQKEILLEHNRDRLVSEGELASIYLYQGDLDKALEFALQVYQVEKEILPYDNRERLTSEFRLARISLKSGVFDPYYNTLIEQPPNLEDPDKIYNQAYLAAYSFLKEDAELMNRAIESVLQISEQSTLHRYDRERNLLIIAEIYLRQQDYPKALTLLERVWAAYDQGHLKDFVYWKKIAKHRLQSCLLSMQLELHPMFPSPEEQPLEDPIHGEWPV